MSEKGRQKVSATTEIEGGKGMPRVSTQKSVQTGTIILLSKTST